MIAKFRLWVKFNKEMIPSVGINPNGEAYDQWEEGRETFVYHKNEDVVIMQFTGRCDSVGKEIYEGDIVNWRGARGTGNYGNGDIVAWNDRTCGFGFKNKWGSFAKLSKSGFATFSTAVKVDVLGNIYENPELLEKK